MYHTAFKFSIKIVESQNRLDSDSQARSVYKLQCVHVYLYTRIHSMARETGGYVIFRKNDAPWLFMARRQPIEGGGEQLLNKKKRRPASSGTRSLVMRGCRILRLGYLLSTGRRHSSFTVGSTRERPLPAQPPEQPKARHTPQANSNAILAGLTVLA